jgi:hypothetical protein
MRIELHRPDPPVAADGAPERTPDATATRSEVVATVDWDGDRHHVRSADPEILRTVGRAFRPLPVVTTDQARRRFGTSGPSMIEAGSLDWFVAVAQVRLPAETGLVARFIPDVDEGGYDPAGGGDTFSDSVERLSAHP